PQIWLLGWSFGTDLALRYGCDPSVVGAILISPPLRFSAPDDLQRWAESGKPLVAIVPELDDYLRPPQARERFAVVPQAEVVDVPRAKHGFGGSALGEDPPSLDASADDVAELLDRLELDRVVLGGLSMGGYVAMAFLRRHRDRVEALILADTKANADPDAAKANRERIAVA